MGVFCCPLKFFAYTMREGIEQFYCAKFIKIISMTKPNIIRNINPLKTSQRNNHEKKTISFPFCSCVARFSYEIYTANKFQIDLFNYRCFLYKLIILYVCFEDKHTCSNNRKLENNRKYTAYMCVYRICYFKVILSLNKY